MTNILDDWYETEVKLKDLKDYPKNPRKISKEAMERLQRRFEKFGYHQRILVNQDNMIIGGHQRKRILKKLGLKDNDLIKVLKPHRNLTEEEFDELNISDNGAYGEYVLDDLANMGYKIENYIEWGVPDYIFGDILTEDNEDVSIEEEEATPDLDEKNVVSKLGDLWILGEHRLLCGDSTNVDDISKLMDNQLADMVFTDPPYNANYTSRVDKSRRKQLGGILNDNMSVDDFDEFLLDINNNLWSFVKEGASIYECIDWKRYPQLANIFSKIFNQKAMIIWNKNFFGLGTYYRTKHEIILFGVKGEKLNIWNAAHDEMDVWDIARDNAQDYKHPTQKPVAIPERAIENSSKKDNIILDLFGGSGSTLIACEKNKRKARIMELDPKYNDLIIKRWQDFTGKKAILSESNKTFDELFNLNKE